MRTPSPSQSMAYTPPPLSLNDGPKVLFVSETMLQPAPPVLESQSLEIMPPVYRDVFWAMVHPGVVWTVIWLECGVSMESSQQGRGKKTYFAVMSCTPSTMSISPVVGQVPSYPSVQTGARGVSATLYQKHNGTHSQATRHSPRA